MLYSSVRVPPPGPSLCTPVDEADRRRMGCVLPCCVKMPMSVKVGLECWTGREGTQNTHTHKTHTHKSAPYLDRTVRLDTEDELVTV